MIFKSRPIQAIAVAAALGIAASPASRAELKYGKLTEFNGKDAVGYVITTQKGDTLRSISKQIETDNKGCTIP